jgi:protein-disulfide isomerase
MQFNVTNGLSRIAMAALAAGLALALTACGSKGDSTDLPKGEPIAAVPPPTGKAWSDVVSAMPEDGMRMGNPDAPIKLVEYGSLSCPHCAKLANDGMPTLISKYIDSGRVSYEFHSYAIHGFVDLPLTVLVRCASKEAFFPLVEQLYATQADWMKAVEANVDKAQTAMKLPPDQRYVGLAKALGLIDWFAARGLPEDQAEKCLADVSAAKKVADDTQKWFKEDGIDSTPTIFMNGNKTNIFEWAELEPALQNAGAR